MLNLALLLFIHWKLSLNPFLMWMKNGKRNTLKIRANLNCSIFNKISIFNSYLGLVWFGFALLRKEHVLNLQEHKKQTVQIEILSCRSLLCPSTNGMHSSMKESKLLKSNHSIRVFVVICPDIFIVILSRALCFPFIVFSIFSFSLFLFFFFLFSSIHYYQDTITCVHILLNVLNNFLSLLLCIMLCIVDID